MIVFAVWLFLFGLWPIHDPGHHHISDSLVVADLVLHLAGAVIVLPVAWRAGVRRLEDRP